MNDPMLPLPGLSPVSGKRVEVKFDGGLLSSDGCALALREVDQRLRAADRLAACMVDPRAPDQITHSLADIIRFRLLMIAAGYEDGNDANCLRSDPMFKMALDLTPSDRELCLQSTISRLENLPDVRALLRMGRAMVDLYCDSFPGFPNSSRSTSTTRSTRSMAANSCGVERPLRRIRISADRRVRRRGLLRIAALRPRSGRAARRQTLPPPAVARDPSPLALHRDPPARPQPLLRPRGSPLVSGAASITPRRRADYHVRRHVESLEASVKARFEAAPRDGKLRRFKEFFDGAQSWSRVERIIARV